MKRKANQLKLAGFLTFALFCLGFNFNAAVSAQGNRTRVISQPTPTATPTVTIVPTPSPTPFQSANVQSLSDLQMRIRNALFRPVLQRGNIGVKIVSLDTDKVVFEQNAEKYFMPASNMKSYTVATALERLSPNFRFVTSVYAPSMPDASGTIKGDLTVYGRGDVSISTAFNEGDYYRGLDSLAQKIVQSGVKRVEGNLVGDESYFSGNPIPPSWEWDDLQWYYGAEISALPLNDNAVDLSVKPSTVNSPCYVQIQPINAIYKVLNQCVTSSSGARRDIRIVKKLDQNILEITGTMPVGDKGFSGFVTISHPAELFVAVLRQLLAQKGVIVTGQNRVVGAKEKAVLASASSVPLVEIAKLESPPFSVIAAKTMKPSQNLYTETILWALGEQVVRKRPLYNAASKNSEDLPKGNSDELGKKVVQDFLKEIGIPADSVIQHDGSGLSRHNLITPAATVQLYTYMAKQSRYVQAWRDSLTIGGVDGTLANRFKGTSAAGNVRGKTGTIDQVSALSGYVTSASGEQFVFSILVNGVASSSTRQATIDEIVVALANFNGKTN